MDNDTSPSALRHHVELMRRVSPARRFAAVRSLSGSVAWLSRRALQSSMPDATEDEVDLAFVALHYGDELAEQIRRHRAAPA